MSGAPLRQVPASREPGTRAPPAPPGQLWLNELYVTVQGECAFQGTPTTFVRTSHCPLRCVWCDSKYTFTEGTLTPTTTVLQKINALAPRHVCLTGGEPLAQAESFRLVEALVGQDYTVEVETSGSEDIAPFNALAPKLRQRVTVNLDVKCPGSAMSNFNRWTNLDHLRPHDQVKFILADRADYEWARATLQGRRFTGTIWFHPVWKALEPATLVEWVLQDRLQVRVGIQMHKYIWGDRRGV